jgi:hypothetical protein
MRAEAGAAAHGRRGLTVARVVIEPRKFLEWRRVHRGKITEHDRMHYAISLYAEREDIGQANR